MIILVQGAPCTGKSTLCLQLSESLAIDYVSKDHVYEALFAAGVVSPGSHAANALLFKRMESQTQEVPLIVETNFGERDRERLSNLVTGEQHIIEVFLYGAKDVLLERFIKRWESGVRHLGHQDGEKVEALSAYLDSDPEPMALGEHLLRLDAELSPSEIVKRAVDFLRTIEPTFDLETPSGD